MLKYIFYIILHFKAIRTKSAELTPFLVPIIRYSLDIKEKAYIYLQEDGLELLLSYIESCATYNDDMLSLINYLLPLLGKHEIRYFFI